MDRPQKEHTATGTSKVQRRDGQERHGGTDSRGNTARQGQAWSSREAAKEDIGGQTLEGTHGDRNRQGPAERSIPQREHPQERKESDVITGEKWVQDLRLDKAT